MKVLILNGHQPYEFAKGELNAAFANKAREFFEARGDEVRLTKVSDGYDVDEEVENHR